MNTPKKSPNNPKSPEERRIITSRDVITALLVVAAFSIGRFSVGKDEKKLKNDKPAPCTVTPNNKTSIAYEALKKRIHEMKKIKEAAMDWNSGVCEWDDQDILGEAKDICREKSLEFARAIGITDSYDIDRIISNCLRGYKIEGLAHTRTGEQIIKFSRLLTENDTLDDAGIEGGEDEIFLTEKINEDAIPDQYRAPEDYTLSPEEKDLLEKKKNADYKGIVDSLNSQKVLDAASNDAEMREFFSGLIKIAMEARDIVLSDSISAEIKIAIACNLVLKIDNYIGSSPENITDRLFEVAEYREFMYYLMEYFTEALPILAGLEEDNEDECINNLSGIVDKCIQEKLGNKF